MAANQFLSQLIWFDSNPTRAADSARPQPLVKAIVTTGNRPSSSVAQTVGTQNPTAISELKRLTFLKSQTKKVRNDEIWDNLKKYVQSRAAPNAGPVQQFGIPVKTRDGEVVQGSHNLSAWSSYYVRLARDPNAAIIRGNAPHDPCTRGEQDAARERYLAWLRYHNARKPRAVNREESIQDETLQQLLNPLTEVTQGRYKSTQQTRELDAKHPSLRAVRLPFWGRACPKDHPTLTQQPKSGYPEFVLWHEIGVSCAVIENKTFWAYDEDFLNSFFSAGIVDDQTGDLKPRGQFRGGTVQHDALKQIWAQVSYFKNSIGAFTTGGNIFIFVKVGENEMCVSDVHKWTDEDVLEVLAGMSFLAIDDHVGLGLFPGQQTTWDILCPPYKRSGEWKNRMPKRPGDE
ncbi:hypothetical protein EIP91_010083 [Steccherinum ochraceum]|uniref:Uncharacterized protein n=1 Tax=Steccherinum ochraceum TaxID=92696 RepID=A0A4V6N7B3_9APHY|nr:hypothetical protein EIP91_010083 [Steccherinum ochraceum]